MVAFIVPVKNVTSPCVIVEDFVPVRAVVGAEASLSFHLLRANDWVLVGAVAHCLAGSSTGSIL